MFDENKDGMIDLQELEGMMSKFGEKPEPADLKKMLDSVDTDGTSTNPSCARTTIVSNL